MGPRNYLLVTGILFLLEKGLGIPESGSNNSKITSKESCQIDLNKLKKKYTPIFASKGKFLYPSLIKGKDTRITIIPEGSDAEMFCQLGSKEKNPLLKKDQKKSKLQSLPLTCSKGKLISKGKGVNPRDIKCQHMNEPSLRVRTNSNCSSEGLDPGKEVHITHVTLGWNVVQGFVQQIELCLDDTHYSTLWTRHTIHGKHIAFRDKEAPRINFMTDETEKSRFFGGRSTSEINKSYSKRLQRAALTKITGQTKVNGRAIIDSSPGSSFYLARGHLSPDAGFVNYAEQLATYYFINTAPQYQTFNNGNWKALEMATRDFAEKANSDIEITTGTFDILSYANKKLFLLDGKFIPVPRIFWKVLYDRGQNRAVAFIGSNDVLSKKAPPVLCKDVCDQIPWVNWDRKNIMEGYMYCCKAKDIRNAIPYAPNLNVPLLISPK